MNLALPKPRFSVRQLALATLAYAFLFAIVGAVRAPGIQVFAAAGVVAVFAIGDLLFGNSDGHAIPIHGRCAQAIAMYGTALALAAAMCLALFIAFPPSEASSRELPLFANSIDENHDPVGAFVVYAGLFGILSTIAFGTALVALNFYPSAFALMYANTPGVACLGFTIYAAWLGAGAPT